jgi:hypothetical protein
LISHDLTGRGGPDRRAAASAHLTLPVRSRKYGPATGKLNRMTRISVLAEAIGSAVRDVTASELEVPRDLQVRTERAQEAA